MTIETTHITAAINAFAEHHDLEVIAAAITDATLKLTRGKWGASVNDLDPEAGTLAVFIGEEGGVATCGTLRVDGDELIYRESWADNGSTLASGWTAEQISAEIADNLGEWMERMVDEARELGEEAGEQDADAAELCAFDTASLGEAELEHARLHGLTRMDATETAFEAAYRAAYTEALTS